MSAMIGMCTAGAVGALLGSFLEYMLRWQRARRRNSVVEGAEWPEARQMVQGKITPAIEGDSLQERAQSRLTSLGVPSDVVKQPVGKRTATKLGQWVCIDCGHAMHDNIAAWEHARVSHDGDHRLAWWTARGFEEP